MGLVDFKSQYIVCLIVSLKVDLHFVAGIGTFDYNKSLRRNPTNVPVYVVFRRRPNNTNRKNRALIVVWAERRVTIADTIKRLLTGRSPTARIVESARAANEHLMTKGKISISINGNINLASKSMKLIVF